MGLFQVACETYDNFRDYVGVEREGHAMLLPVSHIQTTANIEITIDSKGDFISATSVSKDAPKIAIPVTEESGGRTSAPSAHPLCDQLQYVASFDDDKHRLYLEQLRMWAESDYSHPKVKAVFEYVKKNTVIRDLLAVNCVKLDAKGGVLKPKDMVCWNVIGLEHNSGPCWNDRSLFDAFIQYNQSGNSGSEQDICMISGELSVKAKQHPKGVISLYGNAKLISANDKTNFTYRGRFCEDSQALSVSYIASQKAHNAIRWIASEQSMRDSYGGRTILCWNPEGIEIPAKPSNPLLRRTVSKRVASDYKEQLYNTVMSFKSDHQLRGTEKVVIAIFDAATTGRLSLTYYAEKGLTDYLERLQYWDDTAAWNHSIYGVDAPALWEYVNCAFGIERNGKLEVDDRVKAQQIQRMIACRIDGAMFPADIEQLLVNKASNLIPYSMENKRKILFIACSAVRKYRKDRFKEDWKMSLEKDKNDLSYQYGRLLAVMDKIETDVIGGIDGRETSAARLQSVFSRRPQYATRIIMEQLKKAYIPKLNVGAKRYYDKLIGEIYEKISAFPDEILNRTLEDTYLMGYYLQKNALYTKKIDEEEN